MTPRAVTLLNTWRMTRRSAQVIPTLRAALANPGHKEATTA